MTPLSIPALSEFLPLFLAGMAVNFEIAAIAIALGLLLGVLLAATRVYGGFFRAPPAPPWAVLGAPPPPFFFFFFFLTKSPEQRAPPRPISFSRASAPPRS